MICVSIGKISYPDLLVLLNNEQLVEIRLDLNNFSDDEIRAIFSSKAEIIATCRPGTFTETERIEKLKICIEAGASYADLELETGEEYLKELSTLSGENGCKLIISCHDHEKTPSSSELKRIYRSCSEKGADVIKIVCNIISGSDNARLLSLYDKVDLSEKIPLIAIGMGEKGKITRIAAPLLGAPFTYASSDDGKETAKGQIGKSVLKEIYKLITDEKN